MKTLAREIRIALLGTVTSLGAIVSVLPLTAFGGVADGHLAMWSFNGDSMYPTAISDKSGKGNNGIPTSVGITWDSYGGDYYSSWWSQKGSEVATFDGATSFIIANEVATVLNAKALRLNASPFTISAWVMVDAIGEGTTIVNPVVNKPGWNLSISTAMMPYGYWDYDIEEWVDTIIPMGSAKFCSGAACVESPFIPELFNTWANVAVTYINTTKVATLYVNGVKQAISGPTPAFPAPAATAGPLLIGKSQDDSSFFSGKMDDVRIYNRVLSSVATATVPNEIRELGKGCAPATFTPATGKVIVPCVAVTGYYPTVYYNAGLQQAYSTGADANVPAIDDISFGIPLAPKAIVAPATNPEPVWGASVAAYSGAAYYHEPFEYGPDRYLLSGWLYLPRVGVISPVANPKTECYGVYLDQIFANNRFVLVDWAGLNYLGADCDNVYYYNSASGEEGAASGEGTQPKPHREIPKPPPVRQ
jgi:hypothetical protein